MKKILVDYIVIAPAEDFDREILESNQNKTFKSLDDLAEIMGAENFIALTIPEFLKGINDGDLDILSSSWVVQIKLEVDEPRFNILDYDENVVKANLDKAGVDRYLQGKDASLYFVEPLN